MLTGFCMKFQNNFQTPKTHPLKLNSSNQNLQPGTGSLKPKRQITMNHDFNGLWFVLRVVMVINKIAARNLYKDRSKTADIDVEYHKS